LEADHAFADAERVQQTRNELSGTRNALSGAWNENLGQRTAARGRWNGRLACQRSAHVDRSGAQRDRNARECDRAGRTSSRHSGTRDETASQLAVSLAFGLGNVVVLRLRYREGRRPGFSSFAVVSSWDTEQTVAYVARVHGQELRPVTRRCWLQRFASE